MRTQLLRAFTVLAASASLLTACEGDTSGGSDAPRAIEATALAGPLFTGLQIPFEVRVLDGDGEPMPNVRVALRVTSGGGSVDPSLVTDLEGTTTGQWKLVQPGPNTLELSVPGSSLTRTLTVDARPVPQPAGGSPVASPAALGSVHAIWLRLAAPGGAAMPGVTVDFAVKEGQGTVSPAQAVTDAEGFARATWTLGAATGPNLVAATVAGTPINAVFTTETRHPKRVAFQQDSLVVAGLKCQGELFAPVTEGGALVAADGVNFTSTVPGAVSFAPVMVAGTTRGMRTYVIGEQVGSTQVVATHSSGAADTVAVRVAPNEVRNILGLGSLHILAIGGTHTLQASAANACNAAMPGAPLTFRSLTPAVASVSASGVVTGLAEGDARIIAESGTASAVAEFRLRRVVVAPADTTVYPGDVVTYRVTGYNLDGTPMQAPVGGVWTNDLPVARVSDQNNAPYAVTAVALGVARIEGVANGHRGYATLRVQPRP